MSKKDQCKEIMGRLFGPATADLVDTMSDDDCVARCRQKVETMLGPELGKEFDGVN